MAELAIPYSLNMSLTRVVLGLVLLQLGGFNY